MGTKYTILTCLNESKNPHLNLVTKYVNSMLYVFKRMYVKFNLKFLICSLYANCSTTKLGTLFWLPEYNSEFQEEST